MFLLLILPFFEQVSSTFFFLHFWHGRIVGLKGVLVRQDCFE